MIQPSAFYTLKGINLLPLTAKSIKPFTYARLLTRRHQTDISVDSCAAQGSSPRLFGSGTREGDLGLYQPKRYVLRYDPLSMEKERKLERIAKSYRKIKLYLRLREREIREHTYNQLSSY